MIKSANAKQIYTLLAVIGLLLMGFAFWKYMIMKDLDANGIHGNGVVVENVYQRSNSSGKNRGYAYYPKVEFTAPDGQKQSFISTMFGSTPALYTVGQPVEIVYPKDDISKAQILDFSYWGLPAIFGAIGLILFIVGGWGRVSIIRKGTPV